MFRIKICGIRNVNDAQVAARAGADAIGLNFFKKSRRFVEPDIARRIVDSLPPATSKVGVFVNHTPEEIANIVDLVGLDCVQLHGDEPATIFAKLPTYVEVIRAFRCGDSGLTPAINFLDEISDTCRACDAFLVDADAGLAYGGTGKRADWDRINSESFLLCGMPLILAGGLTPDNVGTAIESVRPYGVDVASGVESEGAVKDHELIIRFVDAAICAFARK